MPIFVIEVPKGETVKGDTACVLLVVVLGGWWLGFTKLLFFVDSVH